MLTDNGLVRCCRNVMRKGKPIETSEKITGVNEESQENLSRVFKHLSSLYWIKNLKMDRSVSLGNIIDTANAHALRCFISFQRSIKCCVTSRTAGPIIVMWHYGHISKVKRLESSRTYILPRHARLLSNGDSVTPRVIDFFEIAEPSVIIILSGEKSLQKLRRVSISEGAGMKAGRCKREHDIQMAMYKTYCDQVSQRPKQISRPPMHAL